MSTRVCVAGALRRDAEKRDALDGAAVLVLAIEQARVSWPFECRYVLGLRPEDHIRAEDLARRLKRGMPACITVEGFRIRTDHGDAVLLLTEPTEIKVGETIVL